MGRSWAPPFLASLGKDPRRDLASGAVCILVAFACTLIVFWLADWGGLILVAAASVLVSLLVLAGLILLALPARHGWDRATIIALLLYAAGGVISWLGPLAAVNAPWAWALAWPFFLVLTHGCFVDPALWHCFPR